MYIWLLYVWLLWYLYVWLLWYKSYVPSVYFQFIFQYLLIGDLITHHCDHIFFCLVFDPLKGGIYNILNPRSDVLQLWCPLHVLTPFFFHILSGFDTMVKISCVHLGRVGVLRASSCVSALFSVTFFILILITFISRFWWHVLIVGNDCRW